MRPIFLTLAVGGAGILVEWRSYLLRCGQAFRRWSAVEAKLWATQYLLFSAWTAALTMGNTALRTLFSGRLKLSSAGTLRQRALCCCSLR